MIEQFATWLEGKQGEIEKVGLLLATQLPTDPIELIEEATVIEAWGGRMGELLANSEAFLSNAKLFYLPDAGDLREAERKAIVDAKVSDIRRVRDILQSYQDCIEKRISLIQSILRFQNPHITPDVKGYPGSAADIMRDR